VRILNVHKRVFNLSKDKITELINTLSSPSDKVWPKEKWPKMKLDNGLSPGSKGGHGPIKYFVESHSLGKQVVFKFTRPKGFNGVHKFDINELSTNKTELVHTIDMEAKGKALLLWYTGVKWLHNALIEDGLDKIHNNIENDSKKTKWNLWVRILRVALK